MPDSISRGCLASTRFEMKIHLAQSSCQGKFVMQVFLATFYDLNFGCYDRSRTSSLPLVLAFHLILTAPRVSPIKDHHRKIHLAAS